MKVQSQFIEMFGECQRKEKLSSLCETFIDGDWIESKDQSEDGIRLVQTGNVGYGYFKDKEDKSRYISEETFNRLHCTEIFAGDILVSRLPDPIGRACIIPEGIGRMITAVDCSIIRLKDVILPEYFISYTMTSTYSAQINEVTTGTTRRRVSRANLGNVLVPCPSLEAQRQFVAISQQADKSKFVGFKSQFIEMFGAPDFMKRLGDYVSVRTGKLDANASVEDGQYPFFTCAEKTLSIDTYAFDCIAVLLAGNGEFCVKHYNGKFNAYQRTYVIESKDESVLSTKYLYAWLKDYANILKANAIGGVIKYIKLGDITNAQINLPVLERQLGYVRIYEQADKSKYYYQIA